MGKERKGINAQARRDETGEGDWTAARLNC